MDAKLLAHCGTTKVDRAFLENIETPPRTDTFQPIPHSVLVNAVEESLAFRHIRLERTEFAISKDGMKMFGLLEVNQQYEGVQFAIGLRNSNDKSLRLGMVAGYRVFVCDNLALNGDFQPMLAKHTKNLDLIESVAMGIDRIQRGWKPLREQIDMKRKMQVYPKDARVFIYKAFIQSKLPVSLFKNVADAFEKCEDQSLWALENHFTESFKKLKPIAQFQAAAKLGKIMATIDPNYVAPGEERTTLFLKNRNIPIIDIIPEGTNPSLN